MIWMKSTELMRKHIELLRYDRGNCLPFILGLVTLVLVLTNLFMVFLNETDNLEKCMLAMKDALTVVALFSCFVKRFIYPEESIRLTRLIEEEFFLDRCKIDVRETKWRKIKTLYDEKRHDMESSSETICVFVVFAYSGFILRYLFLELLGASLKDDPRGFPTPIVTHSPSDYDQFSFLINIFALHCFLMLYLALEAFNDYASLWLCVKKIMTDFETIYILLNEIAADYPGFTVDDYLVKGFGLVQQGASTVPGDLEVIGEHYQKLNWFNDAAKRENLRKDMKLIVKFHQNLNRNQDDCSRSSGYSILVMSFLVALDTCFSIFLMLQANNLKMFMNYAAACICTNIPLLLNYYIGQQISNQNETFRRSLSELPWIDKPRWFKQSMLIMMIRANVDMEFKPYGVFVLNLTSYKDLMKAAFSFGNVLYRRKQIMD